MSRFQDQNFVDRWVASLNADSEFFAATELFDGSVLLADGDAQIWFKIYSGKVIDRRQYMPPIGFTFKLGAPTSAWGELAAGTPFTDLLLGGKRRFRDQMDISPDANLTPGAFSLEGDLMSAYRIIEAIYLITDHYRSTAKQVDFR